MQCLVAALGVLVAQPIEAQIAPAVSAPQGKEDPITLSPFEVHAQDERGYVATSSLVGSRVNTELKDIASQIDVLTPEFLQDIGATSIADAVVYSSNFGAPNDQNIGANDGVANVSLEGRARGMDAATVSTDFYTSNLPVDFYNVERLNLAYGAQSVLFGLGNAGGVLDAASKRALMRNRSSAELKFDSWGSRRAVLDFNQQLIPQKLAVRLVGLASDAQQFTEGGQQESLRGYGTVTYKPFAKTTVRVSYEQIDIDTRRATNYVSYDFASPWIAGGSRLFDNSVGNGSIAATDPQLSRNTNALRVLSYGVGPDGYVPWNGTAVTKGPHEVPGATNLNARSLLDGSIYPTDRDPRVSSRENQIEGRQLRASIEQKITSDLVFELGFNYEDRDEHAGGAFDNAESVNIRVDPNRYLPGGTAARPVTTPNPNAGKLYIESFPHGRSAYDETREVRLTGFYEFSAAKHLSEGWRWLGRHRLATLLSHRQDRNESQEDRAIVVGNPSFATGDKLNNSRLLRTRYYLDSPRDSASTGSYTAGAVPGAGMFGPWVVTDPATNTPVTYVMFDNPDGSGFAPVGTKVKVDTAMAALQSFFWRDRLNVFVGLRQDHVKTYYFDAGSTTRRDQVARGDELGLFPRRSEAHYESEPAAVKTALMRTYGVVFHPLPWASLFYNTSENTSLPPGRFGPFGNALQGVGSDGIDWGVRVSLLRDRVSLRLNFFEDNQKDFWNNPFTQLRNFSANIEQRLRGVDRPAGLGPVPASTFDPIANPLELYRSVTDKSSKGLDAVLVANLTPNWTLRATVGRQKNLVKKRGAEWIEWIEQRLPVWESAGGRGWDNVTLSSTDSRSIHQYYDQVIVPQITAQKLANGVLRFREREWRANVFTNYRFKTGRLNGFNVGGGVRWWSEGMTGHGGVRIPGIANLVDDTSIVYRHAEPQTFCDLALGYRRNVRLAGREREIDFRINVRNLLDKDGLEVSRTDQLGVDYEYLRVTPRQFVFSASLGF
jgi:outer membrane receptor for monomeric catechols